MINSKLVFAVFRNQENIGIHENHLNYFAVLLVFLVKKRPYLAKTR